MIELGGNIQLHGFESLDRADALIAKKLVGGYVRRICDEIDDCKGTAIFLEEKDGQFEVRTQVTDEKGSTDATASGPNVFMTIDASLKKLLAELQIKL